MKANLRLIMRSMLSIVLLELVLRSAHGEELNTEQLAQKFTQCVLVVQSSSSSDPANSKEGTGFILSADGLIVTNYHVIDGCDTFKIKSSTGGTYEVSGVLASDKRRDIAILKIGGQKLPTVDLGNSDEVVQGMKIAVIGNPEGFESSITEGIVSAIRADSEHGAVIQISAAISHGSSGSPVFNASGKVIGMATFNIVDGQALNFAVVSNSISQLLLVARNNGNKGSSASDGSVSYKPDSSIHGSKEQDSALAKDDRYAALKKDESNKDYFSMLSLAKQLVKDYPESALAFRALSDSYFYAKLADDAFAAAYKAIDLDPSSPRGWNNLAILTEEFGGGKQKVLDIYSHAIKLAPDDAKLLTEYAIILGEGNKEVSLSALKHAKELLLNGRGTDVETQSYPNYAEIVNAYLDLNENDEAYSTGLQFLHKTTSSPELYLSFAEASVSTKQYQSVETILQKVCSLDPSFRKIALVVLGDSEMKQGHRQAAIDDYKQSYSLDSSNLRTLTGLCYLIANKDNLSQEDLYDIRTYVAKIGALDAKQGKQMEEEMVRVLKARLPQ